MSIVIRDVHDLISHESRGFGWCCPRLGRIRDLEYLCTGTKSLRGPRMDLVY